MHQSVGPVDAEGLGNQCESEDDYPRHGNESCQTGAEGLTDCGSRKLGQREQAAGEENDYGQPEVRNNSAIIAELADFAASTYDLEEREEDEPSENREKDRLSVDKNRLPIAWLVTQPRSL